MAAPWQVTQDGQVARITTALGKDGAFLEDFTVTEALSEPFRMVCEVICPKAHSFMEHRGSGLSLEVVEGGPMVQRAFHGLLTEATLLDAVDGGYRFRLTARPWFWVLSLGRNSRIFQHKSAQTIIKEVFEKAGVAASHFDLAGLSNRGVIVREYCVQYQESDFAFLSRLMEEEGIYYFFAHTANSHVLKLCDNKAAHADFASGDVVVRDDLDGTTSTPHLTTISRHLRPTIKKYAVRDQHWKVFGDMLDAAAETDHAIGDINPEVFEYPGGFAYLTDDGATKGGEGGANVVSLGLHADLADGLVHTGYGDTFAVPVGAAVNLVWNGQTAKMLVNGATHRLSGQRITGAEDTDPAITTVELDMVMLEQGWRPKRITPKPHARGPQVATVVGKKGKEIDIDADGRVRVQFPWDRADKKSEESSCWIRVSTGWAGPNLGEYMVPRIGQEVLVEYIEGDMDRPVVTGRLHDSKNAFHAPEWIKGDWGDEPFDHATLTGWVTQTVNGKSTQGYDGAVEKFTNEPGANYILFDDASGRESINIRGQRDFFVFILRDTKHLTQRDQNNYTGRHLLSEIETGNETHIVKAGKRTTTVNKDETLTVEGGNMSTTVETGDQTTKVSKGNQSIEVSMGNQDTAIKMGNQSTDVKMGNISVKADLGKIDMEAMQSITLKVGMSKITVDQMGVKIEGMMLKNDAKLMSQSKATLMTKVEASLMMMVKGLITMIN